MTRTAAAAMSTNRRRSSLFAAASSLDSISVHAHTKIRMRAIIASTRTAVPSRSTLTNALWYRSELPTIDIRLDVSDG